MRPSIEKLLKEMPDSERRELDNAGGRTLIKSLDEKLNPGENVLGLASVFIPGDSPRATETGVIAHTEERVLFGSMGPGVSSSTPDWRGWKWPEVQGARDRRPMLGGVELYLRVGGQERKFHVGGTKGPSKDWAQQRICQKIAAKAAGPSGGGAFR